MQIRNAIKKLLVSWDSFGPDHFEVTNEWSEVYPGLKMRAIEWTDGAKYVYMCEARAGLDFGYHLHPDYDENLFLISGEADIQVGETHNRMIRGDYLLIPRGILHRGIYNTDSHVLLFFTK